jgi:hypothetical protein
MNYRLLIDYAVIEFLDTMPHSQRRMLRNRFVAIRDNPRKYSDYKESDINLRLLDIHVYGKYAIKFWEDPADGHVKILDLHFADGHGRKTNK